MGELFRYLRGYLTLRICGAAPEYALNRLTQARVYFWGLRRLDAFSCEIRIRKKDLEQVRQLVSRAQCDVEIQKEAGFFLQFRGLKRRKAFAAAVCLILAAAYFLPHFVWFVRVEGNEAVPAQQILREISQLGIGFGTDGSDIVPQDLKNRMLVRIPQLEWLTVNRSGCIATVVVRERSAVPQKVERRMVTNMVAARDCIITNMEVLSGQAVQKAGDTVRQGELLISGYVDLEYCTQATRALGEVYGRTWREQNAILPAEYQYKTGSGEVHRRYALLIGKKRINFYRDSGIWGDGCDKMTMYYPLTLPGGYTFPVTLVEETAVERTVESRALTPAQAGELLTDAAVFAASNEMIAGEILRQDLDVTRDGGVYRLNGVLECHEMVARTAPAILMESEGIS